MTIAQNASKIIKPINPMILNKHDPQLSSEFDGSTIYPHLSLRV